MLTRIKFFYFIKEFKIIFIIRILIKLLKKTKPKGLKSEWSVVFYISAAIFGTGSVVYTLFGNSNLEAWAVIEDGDKE